MVRVQGYEPQALRLLLKLKVPESEFKYPVRKFNYSMTEEGVETWHEYTPDICLPSVNLFIEVKSLHTLKEKKKGADKIGPKLDSVVGEGFKALILVMDEPGKIVDIISKYFYSKAEMAEKTQEEKEAFLLPYLPLPPGPPLPD